MSAIKAPNKAFAATSDKSINLADHKGQYIVLYFYPKDSTPGCTTESKGFRDFYNEFKALNAEVLGVSRDKLASHEKFKCKHEMPFELIADTESELCDHFDVIGEKKMFGKAYTGIIRSTFLIDPKGKVIKEWRKVKVSGHVEAVLADLKEIQLTNA